MGTLHESKYGDIIIDRETLDGEPAFLLRGQDILAIPALQAYATAIHSAAKGAQASRNGELAQRLATHADHVLDVCDGFARFAEQHRDKVRLPD